MKPHRVHSTVLGADHMSHRNSPISGQIISHRNSPISGQSMSPTITTGKAAAIFKGFIDEEAGTTGVNMFVHISLLPSPADKAKQPTQILSFTTSSGEKPYSVPAVTYSELSKVKSDKRMIGKFQVVTGNKHFKQFDSVEEASSFGQQLADACF